MERPLAQQGPPRRQGEEKALEDAAAALEAHTAAAADEGARSPADDESPGLEGHAFGVADAAADAAAFLKALPAPDEAAYLAPEASAPAAVEYP